MSDDISIFGSVYDGNRSTLRRDFSVRAVRQYKGENIPWEIHDCDGDNGCRFCRRKKREFIAAKKGQTK